MGRLLFFLQRCVLATSDSGFGFPLSKSIARVKVSQSLYASLSAIGAVLHDDHRKLETDDCSELLRVFSIGSAPSLIIAISIIADLLPCMS